MMSEAERAVENANGALEVLDTLVEEFAERLGEANQEAEKEALENILGHLEGMRREYAKRREAAAAGL